MLKMYLNDVTKSAHFYVSQLTKKEPVKTAM